MKWSAMIGASRQALRREAVLAALVHVFALCRAARGAVVFPTLLGGRPSPSIPSGTVAAWPRAVVRRLCSFVCATLVLCGVKRRWLARRRLALRVFATLEKSACRGLVACAVRCARALVWRARRRVSGRACPLSLRWRACWLCVCCPLFAGRCRLTRDFLAIFLLHAGRFCGWVGPCSRISLTISEAGRFALRRVARALCARVLRRRLTNDDALQSSDERQCSSFALNVTVRRRPTNDDALHCPKRHCAPSTDERRRSSLPYTSLCAVD